MSGSTIKPWVVGNWKMNPMQADAKQLLQEFKQLLQENEIAEEKCNIGLAPVTLALTSMQAELANAVRSVFTVAQDVSRFGNMGAYTGEVSAELLKDSQIEYVLIGHSERREYFAESAAILNAKAQNALNAGLNVIYCVGETLHEREANSTLSVIEDQLHQGLSDLGHCNEDNLLIAYEPVWAIGTGKTASPAQAQAVHAHIRAILLEKFPAFGQKVRILYGGSVKPDNVEELLAQKDIDGGLVGGASLKAQDFLALCGDS